MKGGEKMKSKTISVLVMVLVTTVFAYMVTADTQCVSQDCSVNTTLTVGNFAPNITAVLSGISITLTAESSKTENVLFNVTDKNSFADLNDSTAQCIGFKTGESDRTSTSCTAFGQSGNDGRYNCTVDFQYFDAAASDWGWNCSVSDNFGGSDYDDAVAFTVNALDFIDVNVTSFAWSSADSNVNDQEANSPVNLDNGGNQDYETAFVTAYNATNGNGFLIPATAFALNNVTGNAAGTQMADGTAVNISSFFTLQHGNAANEDIFAYVDMPAVESGTYTGTSSWLIDITT